VAPPGVSLAAAASSRDPLVAKVADFGLSRLLPLDSDRIVTRTHGTITHMVRGGVGVGVGVGGRLGVVGGAVLWGAGGGGGRRSCPRSWCVLMLASSSGESALPTATRTPTPPHPQAPEVITESLHSKAADVYSFGVVLWELLSCAKPYSGMHYAQIVHAIAHNKVRI